MSDMDNKKHSDACSCGHDHDHDHGKCSCGHDHDHDHGKCSCGHDHDHMDGTCICGHNHKAEGGVGHDRAMGKIFFVLFGGILTLNSFILDWTMPDLEFASELSALLGAFILALPIIITAVKDLINGKVYMNELVALAILAALASADFQTAGIIAFFLLVTIIIETRTASGAQRSIEELIKLTPNTARLLTDGKESEVQATTLKVGDRIRVRPGENFPVDARIIAGESTVNQASITGESIPVEKSIGSDVFAGTQNLTGLVDLEVTKVGEDTTLGKVKDMILQAESSRTPVVRIIDRYAGYYTPTVLMLAWITWWFTEDMNSVIAFLVIACPCAVVLATPTAVVAAVAAAARLGIFIKNVSHLELAGKITSFVFDKTGTLTDGLLSVVKLEPAEGITPAELLKTAGAVERYSNHPTAVAIQKLAAEAGLELDEAAEFSETHGRGVSASVNGEKVLVGRANWMAEQQIPVADADTASADGMSVVYVARAGKVLGWIGFKDKIRKEAPEMLSELRRQGVRFCAMVTGDRQSVAEAVAKQLAIDEFKSECLPDGKVQFVENVKRNSRVAVVGDGVNDAPALAAGDLGIAMGAIGSDIAINSASIALMTNDLRRIALLVFLSRKSQMIINQNLLFGMLFVFGGMILSMVGVMTPIWAAVLHAGSTLIIVFNSARLVRTGEELTLEESAAAAPQENNN
ncbi:MAG: cadmium-translocating P-type ATPase [Lentisphaeria bacterium]|nr:cadmium-translocating P-type ATPase [Lentisphaeria bacterium]